LTFEVRLAWAATVLSLLTLVVPEWIEVLTGLEPDGGSGSIEYVIAGGFLIAALMCAALAHRTYRRLATR